MWLTTGASLKLPLCGWLQMWVLRYPYMWLATGMSTVTPKLLTTGGSLKLPLCGRLQVVSLKLAIYGWQQVQVLSYPYVVDINELDTCWSKLLRYWFLTFRRSQVAPNTWKLCNLHHKWYLTHEAVEAAMKKPPKQHTVNSPVVVLRLISLDFL